MTRQWLAEPTKMCRQHLLGEHFETHMFQSKMYKGYSLTGFRTSSMFFGALFIQNRHNALATLIAGHKTPLIIDNFIQEKYPYIEPSTADIVKSMNDLLTRCEKCRELNV